jgi:AbiTii
MPAMAHKREGLLAQIEAGVLDDRVPLSSLLQKCIVLGGQAGSEKMRDWARRELNGYAGAETVPDYRHIFAPLMARITNSAGYNPMTQRIYASVFPDQIRDMILDKFDLEDAILGGGIGELEALANRDTDEHHLSPHWASFITDTLNELNMAPNSHVAAVYWAVSDASIRGLLVRVRTALAELVTELIVLTPHDQEVPDKLAADQATQFVITGDRPTINYSPQHATGGGTNVTVSTPALGAVTVSGADGTAIGSQTASGANSTMVGSQAALGDHNAIAGQNAANTAANEQPTKEGWWARLRKRGMIVALATIIGGIAAVASTAVAVFAWIGWTPWH